MTPDERQTQMDFLLEQQARHNHEIAQLRRVLLSAIRLGRRERTDIREKFGALVDAQIKTEDSLAAFQVETRQAFSLLTKTLSQTIDRVDAVENPTRNGGHPSN